MNSTPAIFKISLKLVKKHKILLFDSELRDTKLLIIDKK